MIESGEEGGPITRNPLDFRDLVPPLPDGISFEKALGTYARIEAEPELYEGVIDPSFEEGLSPDIVKRLKKVATYSAYYLSLWHVSDDIVDHDFRRGWRARMKDRFGQQADMLENNRMRKKGIQLLLDAADRLLRSLIALPAKDVRTLELMSYVEAILEPAGPLSDFGVRYGLLTRSEKIRTVNAFSHGARAVLGFLAHPYGEEIRRAA